MVVIVYSKSNAVYVFNGTTDLKSNGVSNVGDATSNVISVYTEQKYHTYVVKANM